MRLDTVFDADDEARFLTVWFLKARDKVLCDNVLFFLHYHVTASLFFIGCLLVMFGTFIIDPIDCITDKAVDEVIDNYCLYHSMFTLRTSTEDVSNNLVAHPGIRPMPSATNADKRFHHYYLWVAFFLGIQAVSFGVPRLIWKAWSGAETKITKDLKTKDKGLNGAKGSDDKSDDDILALYLKSSSHRSYYFKLLFCEALNLGNAVLQLVLMSSFLGLGLSRSTYWFKEELLELFHEKVPFQRSNIIEQIFPKVTSCTFYSYGPSGSVVNYQAVCVLPVNAINEKIYVTLYVWLLFLIAASIVAIVYRLLMLVPFVRKFRLKFFMIENECSSVKFENVPRGFGIGNWQLLLQLTGNHNMDADELTTVVKRLCVKSKNG